VGLPGDRERQAVLADLWQRLEEDGEGVSVARRGVAELLAEGLLAFVDGAIAFTERGRAQAAAVVRRVRLAEVLLARTLDRGPTEECGRLDPVAAGFEDQVCAFLDHPNRCPHGRPIAPGPCCVPETAAASFSAVEVEA
jgi:DtxR family transcriptional regulator, Mn-dependent transcriptional regulator